VSLRGWEASRGDRTRLLRCWQAVGSDDRHEPRRLWDASVLRPGGSAIHHHLTYVSSAVELFSGDQLAELLETSRSNNERAAITGMLLYKDGNFMQTIEGPQAAISELRERLDRDPRHRGILVLIDGTREARLFDGWSMGFANLGARDMRDVPGYSEFLNTPLSAAGFSENPDASQRLLAVFKRSMR
jgi:hypothetical protein